MGSVRSLAAGLMGVAAVACGADSPHLFAPPTDRPALFMPRQYRVIDVMAIAPESVYNVRLNGRNEIIANRVDAIGPAFRSTAIIWRNGSTTAMSGCAWAYQINARGQVLCYANPGVGLWQDGSLTRIAGTESFVTDNYYAAVLNDSGDVAGMRQPCADCSGTTYLIHAGEMVALDPPLPPPFFPFHIARINNAGAVLVSDGLGGYAGDAYVVSHGQLVETFGIGVGGVSDMNDAGQIVGTALGHPGNPIVLARHVDGFPKLIGNGLSINNREEIVGQLTVPSFPNDETADWSGSGPFYWSRLAGPLMLRNAATDSAWTITAALQINDAGVILAFGNHATLGFKHLILLVPPS